MLRAWWIARLGDTMDADDMAELFGYTFDEEVDEIDALTLHIRATSNANLMRALAVYMADFDRIPGYSHHSSPLPAPDILNGLCVPLEINTKAIEAETKKAVKADTAQKIKALQAELKANTTATTTPALNTPADSTSKGEGGSQASKPTSTTAKKPATKKTKLSADEALSGIAVAMQNNERAGTAPPEDTDRVHNCASDAFEVGKQVRITTDDTKLGLIERKHGGKTGTITRSEGGGFWDVTFKGRGGGVAMFADDQMEVLAC
jgi:hypothetical protein